MLLKSEKYSPDPDLPTSPQKLLSILDSESIHYDFFEHEPVFTVAESDKINANIPGTHCRNLFLRDKKKRNYLIVAANKTHIDLKKLEALIGSARLSFGSAERLWEYLGVRPGSVCPFAIINDKDRQVKVFLDKYMMDQDIVNYHPIDNGMTIGLKPSDLIKFLSKHHQKPEILDLTPAAPDAKN